MVIQRDSHLDSQRGNDWAETWVTPMDSLMGIHSDLLTANEKENDSDFERENDLGMLRGRHWD